MAKRIVPAQFNGKSGIAIYSISKRVGCLTSLCPNHPDDVALVQYLLKGYFAKADHFRPAGSLSIDGVHGPTTHYWALCYSAIFDLNAKEALGSFSPVSNLATPASEKSILHLNYKFRAVNPALPGDLEKDPAFPAMLRGKFGSWEATSDKVFSNF